MNRIILLILAIFAVVACAGVKSPTDPVVSSKMSVVDTNTIVDTTIVTNYVTVANCASVTTVYTNKVSSFNYIPVISNNFLGQTNTVNGGFCNRVYNVNIHTSSVVTWYGYNTNLTPGVVMAHDYSSSIYNVSEGYIDVEPGYWSYLSRSVSNTVIVKN
jgi:hypothetical protein